MVQSAPNILAHYNHNFLTNLPDADIDDIVFTGAYQAMNNYKMAGGWQCNFSGTSRIRIVSSDFNASYSDSTYGRTNYIRPNSKSCKFFIRYI